QSPPSLCARSAREGSPPTRKQVPRFAQKQILRSRASRAVARDDSRVASLRKGMEGSGPRLGYRSVRYASMSEDVQAASLHLGSASACSERRNASDSTPSVHLGESRAHAL